MIQDVNKSSHESMVMEDLLTVIGEVEGYMQSLVKERGRISDGV